jgi:hypothetical protein
VNLAAGGVGMTLRASDRLVPSWGGDYYVRVDVRSAALTERPPSRDLAVVIDTRDHGSLDRMRRLGAAIFETMRPGDRGALLTSGDGGQVLVPLYSFAAVPLLVERAGSFDPDPNDDLGVAIQRAVAYLSSGGADRTRRLIVFSSSSAVLDSEVREWVSVARQSQIDVVLVPFAVGTAIRFQRLASVTQATAVGQIPHDDAEEQRSVETLSALPSLRAVADSVTLTIESFPGPLHLIEVAGAHASWTPSGGEVVLGPVRAGEDKTLVLRTSVPAWQDSAPFEIRVRVHVHDASGDHDATRTLTARYTASPAEQAASRSGDVLQYVSLLNTLSNVQAAIVRDDPATFGSLREAATLQAHTLALYAREHQDEIMGEQASLLQQLIDSAPLNWQAANP